MVSVGGTAPAALRRRSRSALVVAPAAVPTLALLLGVAGPTAQRWAVDLIALAAAVVATLSCARAARRRPGRERWAWSALALGSGLWAAAQTGWTFSRGILGHPPPVPSWTDAGFLAMPLLALPALGLLAGAATSGVLLRRCLDGCTVAVAVGVVVCSTALEPVVTLGDGSAPHLALVFAYPAADTAMTAVALLVLTGGGARRPTLRLLAAAAVLHVLAELLPPVLGASGPLVEVPAALAWGASFVLLAVAAASTEQVDAEPPAGRPGEGVGLLPYVCVLIAGGVVLTRWISGRELGPVLLGLSLLLVSLVLVRQGTALADNRRLLAILADREALLRRTADTDYLTGLPNRSSFTGFVEASLRRASRLGRPLTVGFLDLDDFKAVNDTLGHACGDELLVVLSERLRRELAPGDVVARLGGDEFAILLDGCAGHAAQAAGSRLVEAVRRPVHLQGRTVRVTASLGLAEVDPVAGVPTLSALLSRADLAMYEVKRRGRDGLAHRTAAAGVPAAAEPPGTAPVCVVTLPAVGPPTTSPPPPPTTSPPPPPPRRPRRRPQRCRRRGGRTRSRPEGQRSRNPCCTSRSTTGSTCSAASASSRPALAASTCSRSPSRRVPSQPASRLAP